MNGREQRGIPSQPWQSDAKPGVLKVSREGEKLVVHFAPGDANQGPYLVRVALLGSGLISKVERGENSGRDLKHDFVALSYDRRPMKKDGAALRAEFDFPKTIAKPSRLALAVLITHADDLAPVQATGGWLP